MAVCPERQPSAGFLGAHDLVLHAARPPNSTPRTALVRRAGRDAVELLSLFTRRGAVTSRATGAGSSCIAATHPLLARQAG